MDTTMRINVLTTDALEQAIGAIPTDYLLRQRWFANKERPIAGFTLHDWAPLDLPDGTGTGALGRSRKGAKGDEDAKGFGVLALVDVHFADGGGSECYFFPLTFGAELRREQVAVLDPSSGSEALFDAFGSEGFCRAFLDQLALGRPLHGQRGAFAFVRVADAWPDAVEPIARLSGEQSNSSVHYGTALMLKAFRKLASGINPDREIGHFLARTPFANVPGLAGYVEYRGDGGCRADVALLQRFVPNEGDVWTYTLSHLRGLYAAAQTAPGCMTDEVADLVRDYSTTYIVAARRLGQVTGQLHKALAGAADDPAFAPEVVTAKDLATWSEQSARRIAATLQMLSHAQDTFPRAVRRQVDAVVRKQGRFEATVTGLNRLDLIGVDKIRLHGDYHLGQVIRAVNGDFVILDFEGEPLRPIKERRAKQLAAKDVAGMLRSFHYAASAALFELDAAAQGLLQHARDAWLRLSRQGFLDGYFGEAAGERFWPHERSACEEMIAIFELDKACYELAYEAASRPDWLEVPLSYLAR